MTRTLIAAAVLVLGATSAQAQPSMPCHNAPEIAKQLNSRYHEAPIAFGLQSNGHLLQIWLSKEKDTWTVVSTSPTGTSCIVAVGKGWQSLPDMPDGPMA